MNINSLIEWSKNSIVDEIILIAILIAILEIIAQTSLKRENNTTFLYIGLCFYILIGFVLHYAYHNVPLSKMNTVWSCLSIVSAISLGYFLYDEPINQYKILAVFLALSSVYAMSFA